MEIPAARAFFELVPGKETGNSRMEISSLLITNEIYKRAGVLIISLLITSSTKILAKQNERTRNRTKVAKALPLDTERHTTQL